MMEIFIPNHVPSSKNSRRVVTVRDKIGRSKTMSIASKSVMKYKKETEWFWTEKKHDWFKMIVGLPKPLEVGFHFVRKTNHKFDFINPLQTIQDQMTHYSWLGDDTCNEIIPYAYKRDNKWYTVDKERPGVWIKIMNK